MTALSSGAITEERTHFRTKIYRNHLTVGRVFQFVSPICIAGLLQRLLGGVEKKSSKWVPKVHF